LVGKIVVSEVNQEWRVIGIFRTPMLDVTQQMKEAVAGADESETIYGKNFDGIPARVLKTPTSEKLSMASRPFFTTIIYRAFRRLVKSIFHCGRSFPAFLLNGIKCL
jgi:hypothetical protein